MTPTKSTAPPTKAAQAAEQTAQRQRALQQAARRNNAAAGKPEQGAVQTGPREQPINPLPAQILEKPGVEADLQLAPRFMAPDYKGSGKLDGMAAIVTGGDSGIGRAVAVLFAREGADVAIVYLSEHEDAQATCQAIGEEGRQALAISGDVRDEAFCKDAVAQTVAAFGKLDVLVNNAGFQQHCLRLEDLSEEHLQETLQTNIGGYFRMARAALPHMKSGSSIVNSGSETGLFGSPQLLDYSATKGAIHAFTQSLASNLAPRGIRVNAVAPGPVWTPLNPADRDEDDIQSFGSGTDLGRPAQPEEISPAYVFLASPITASYITGAILPVMGGPKG